MGVGVESGRPCREKSRAGWEEKRRESWRGDERLLGTEAAGQRGHAGGIAVSRKCSCRPGLTWQRDGRDSSGQAPRSIGWQRSFVASCIILHFGPASQGVKPFSG